MADHFYSYSNAEKARFRDPSLITVGTSSTGANPIELRVTDGALSARDVYLALEYLADLFARRNAQVIPGGTLK